MNCQYCNQERKSLKSVRSHETFCKQNPNRLEPKTEAGRASASAVSSECRFCGKMFLSSNIKKHENSCSREIKHCASCDKEIPHHKKFCNNSCSAKFNNSKRSMKWSDASKKKHSELMKSRSHKGSKNKSCKVKFLRCEVCNNHFMVRSHHELRKSCSNECKIELVFKDRKFVNGKRKTIPYYCKGLGREVRLESSWELRIAEFLDENNIRWIRPKSLKWEDSNGISRRYFPDFYLVDGGIYLDPKNPFCIEKDAEKLEYFKDKISLCYGDVNDVIEFVSDHYRILESDLRRFAARS